MADCQVATQHSYSSKAVGTGIQHKSDEQESLKKIYLQITCYYFWICLTVILDLSLTVIFITNIQDCHCKIQNHIVRLSLSVYKQHLIKQLTLLIMTLMTFGLELWFLDAYMQRSVAKFAYVNKGNRTKMTMYVGFEF